MSLRAAIFPRSSASDFLLQTAMRPFARSTAQIPLFFTILLCNSLLFVGSLNQEGLALLSFKASIFQDPSAILKNWTSDGENPCSWNGIRCRNFSVIAISLPNSNLVGVISPFVGSLPSLRQINLRFNMLYGMLPADLFESPSLRRLVLSGNSFSGSLPAFAGKRVCQQLQVLDLSDNSFNGSIPDSLLQCRKLKILNLGQNMFIGSLPDGIGTSFSSLESLNLSYNRFNGSIPRDLENLSRLKETADFSHNSFSGYIPENLGKLPETVYIDLSYNNLSGAVPQIGQLVDRGPTAFIHNPGLCGPPLQNECSSPTSSPPLPSIDEGDDDGRQSLSKRFVISIAAADVVGIGLMGLVFFYCYLRVVSHGGKNVKDQGVPEKGQNGRRGCSCFRSRNDVSDSLSENFEQYDLVPLDRELGFNLDELLKASAFVLGKSGIGIVYKVVLEDGLTMAVRRLGEDGLQWFKEFHAEIEAIGKIRHANIVTLRAYYWSFDEKLLIYNYIPNGNLEAAIHGNASEVAFSPLSWDTRLKIMKGVAKGLVFLHECSPKRYVHGDLKPSNILLGLEMEPYISDFGVGHLANIVGGLPDLQTYQLTEKQLQQSSEISMNATSFAASCYRAPEALKLMKSSQKWDVYSYGVILLELLSGRSPVILLGNLEMDLVRWFQYCIEEKKPFSEVVDPFLVEETQREDEMIAVLKVALACVQANPERRPMMRHVSDILESLSTNG